MTSHCDYAAGDLQTIDVKTWIDQSSLPDRRWLTLLCSLDSSCSLQGGP